MTSRLLPEGSPPLFRTLLGSIKVGLGGLLLVLVECGQRDKAPLTNGEQYPVVVISAPLSNLPNAITKTPNVVSSRLPIAVTFHREQKFRLNIFWQAPELGQCS